MFYCLTHNCQVLFFKLFFFTLRDDSNASFPHNSVHISRPETGSCESICDLCLLNSSFWPGWLRTFTDDNFSFCFSSLEFPHTHCDQTLQDSQRRGTQRILNFNLLENSTKIKMVVDIRDKVDIFLRFFFAFSLF